MTQKSLDPKEKSANRPRSERKRFLNVIYFIDSNRTRTLKMSIRTSYLTVGTLCLLVTWSLVASLLLVREHGLNTDLRSRSRDLLGVIFGYQTRYDQVYEKAYPTDVNTIIPTAISEASNKTSNPVEIELEDDAEAKVELPSQPNSVKASPIAAKIANSPVAEPPEQVRPEPKEKIIARALEKTSAMAPPVSVENFSSSIQDETLTVRFALKNTNKGNKATGTVTGQARFFENGKEGLWLPTQIEAGNDQADAGDQDDPSSDQHFNIRFYKNKVFHFVSPASKSGLFTAVRITVKDEQGRIKEFTYPLTKEPGIQQSRLEPRDDEEDETSSPQ